MIAHLDCLARWFLLKQYPLVPLSVMHRQALLPVSGCCPECATDLIWSDILVAMCCRNRLLQHLQSDNCENTEETRASNRRSMNRTSAIDEGQENLARTFERNVALSPSGSDNDCLIISQSQTSLASCMKNLSVG